MMRMWKKAKLLGPVGCRTLSKAGYQRLYPRRIEGSQDVGHRGHIFSVRPVSRLAYRTRKIHNYC